MFVTSALRVQGQFAGSGLTGVAWRYHGCGMDALVNGWVRTMDRKQKRETFHACLHFGSARPLFKPAELKPSKTPKILE